MVFKSVFRYSLIFILLILCACNRDQVPPVPTQASIDELATQTVLTQNAPPSGWRDPISFPEIDGNLRELPGWRYEVLMQFEGTYASTSRPVSASTDLEMWFNQLADAQRSQVSIASELSGELVESAYEAVRLGPDSFLVSDGACSVGQAAVIATDLRAGTLIGGIQNAMPAPKKAMINGEEVWRYDFTAADLKLAQFQPASDGRIELSAGELWVAPEHKAVIRFYLTLYIENTTIFNSTLPVTGEVIIRYDLYDIVDSVSAAQNISVPFGC